MRTIIVVPAVLGLTWSVTARPALADTTVVILGTGTPVPDLQRAGAGVAVIYNDKAYVFDVGHGVVQRAIEASQRLGIAALAPVNIDRLLFTHLHSDHAVDYPELVSNNWWRRSSQIRVWGPPGLMAMTEGVYAMMASDVGIRLSGDLPIVRRDGHRVVPTEIAEGRVLEEDGLIIDAFEVAHGAGVSAFGYRVTTPEKTVVISGDTTFSAKLVEMATGADILIHEAISEEGASGLERSWQQYHAGAHTRTRDLARLARSARPALVVITHVLSYDAPVESALTEVRALYDGEVVLAHDLDVF